MKTFFLACMALFIGLSGMSQSSKYASAMQASLQQIAEAKTAADLLALSARFERIAEAEKDQWLPYYYAGLMQVWAGFRDDKSDRDAIGAKASNLMDKAMALNNTSSEPYAVKSMSATLRMMVNPMERWQTYGTQSGDALKAGLALDPKNPRLYYLQGQTMMNTPAQFGGGKDKAAPLFEKAVQLYQTKPADPLMPDWGREDAASLLAKCKS